MANKSLQQFNQDTISDVFRILVEKSGKKLNAIAEETKIPLQSIYSLHNRKSKVANIRTLKLLADYFGEDLTVFCGLMTYHPPRKLTAEEERLINEYGTLTDDAKLQVLGLLSRLRSNPENLVKLI